MQFTPYDFVRNHEIVIDCNTLVANSKMYAETILPKIIQKAGEYDTANRVCLTLLEILLRPVFTSHHLENYSLHVSNAVITLTLDKKDETYLHYLVWCCVEELNNC